MPRLSTTLSAQGRAAEVAKIGSARFQSVDRVSTMDVICPACSLVITWSH